MTDDLYILESSCGWIKIGRSRDVEKRRRLLAQHYPPSVTLSVLANAPGLGAYEYALHAVLVKFRGQGEWFDNRAAVILKKYLALATLSELVIALDLNPSNSKGQKMRKATDERRRDGNRWTRHRQARSGQT